MAKIDLENVDVKMHFLKVYQIRNDEFDIAVELLKWLDAAQGPVFTGEMDKVYLVIEITK